MPTIALLCIDLDGTLVDSAGEIAEAANRALAGIGLARQPEHVIAGFIGAGGRELMLRLLRHLGDTGAADSPVSAADREAAVRAFADHYATLAGTSCRAYPGVAGALRRLQAAGVRLACVTNKDEREAKAVLEHVGLLGFFDALVGGDTVGVKKPDARMIRHAIGLLGGTRERTAHLGDSQTDVATARNAGVAAWVVPYGYNGGQPIEGAGADREFADLAAVADEVIGDGR